MATLGSYRVFGCKGPTSTSLVLQALTTAVQYDKMEIIVLPEIAIVDKYSIELRETIEVAARQGVIMIVAATTNNFMNQQYFSYQGLSVLSVGGARQDYRPMHCTLNERFNGFKKESIALVWYDRSKMPDLFERAKAIGMTALIIVNDATRMRQKCDIPLFGISERDALFIIEGYKNKLKYKYIFAEKYGYIENGNVTVDTAGPQNKPFIPPFYPDILAPSHEIYTATITQKQNKPHFSDISAAVAYVAGAAALIAEANQYSSIDIEYIKTALQNNAVPLKDTSTDYYASALYQGAGMLNLNKLIDTEAIYVSPSSIDVGVTHASVVNVPIQISPLSATLLSYKLSHIPTAAVLMSKPIGNMFSRPPVAAVVSYPQYINLQPNQIDEFTITISMPMNILKDEIWLYSGYIVIDPNPRINGLPSNRAVFVPYYGTVYG
ncbi:peptidase S8/S53 domain-containing protein [Syncephalis fuscata]|nr:peptidase S8/S53 domain-containing protein [Syncephalis fuscata]